MTTEFDLYADNTQTQTAEQRKQALAMAVSREVAANGWRVESQSDFQTVLAKGKPVNHLLHFILCWITLGFWVFVWPIAWYLARRQTLILSVDEYGNVLHQS